MGAGRVRAETEKGDWTGESGWEPSAFGNFSGSEHLVRAKASVLYVNDTNYYATYSSIRSRQFGSFS